MRRKLIDFDVFKKINEDSLSTAESELTEAQDILAKALKAEDLKLHCFSKDSVVYETLDHSYVHASYRLNDKSLVLENIEELVIDEKSAKNESRQILNNMLDEILNGNDVKASETFDKYLGLPSVRRSLMEGNRAGLPKNKKRINEATKAKKTLKESTTSRFNKPATPIKKVSPKKMHEWSLLSENVFGYLEFQEYGPAMNQTNIQSDNKGNVVAIAIPTSRVRNEGKILSFNWKTLNTEVQVLRGKAWTYKESADFAKAMANLRKFNAMSDNEGLEQTLENIVSKWPHVIYLTQTELANVIGEALESLGESNYDDQMCEFMAEGILRTATEAYTDRVNKIIRLSGNQVPEKTDDFYEHFQKIVNEFYANLDGNMQLEMQVFTDLYNALAEIHKVAHKEGNELLKSEADHYLRDLHSVLSQETEPTLELAGEVAAWLNNLVETNLETEPWNVSNSTYITKAGENPRMAQLASQSYTPSKDFSGDWGDVAPVSDGKNYKGKLADEMRNNSWGNWSNDETYPALQNPYVVKPFGKYTMNDPDGADKSGDSDWSRWQSNDTWPALQNPYSLKAETPYTYKMNHGKESDLVVDK